MAREFKEVAIIRGDKEAYDNGWDRIFDKKKKDKKEESTNNEEREKCLDVNLEQK